MTHFENLVFELNDAYFGTNQRDFVENSRLIRLLESNTL